MFFLTHMYQPVTPSFIGKKVFPNVDIRQILPRIDWRFFFHAWRITGNYEGLESLCDCAACKTQWLLRYQPEDREKAEEAYKLMRDAQEVLREGIKEKIFTISALLYYAEAKSEDEGITIQDLEGKRVHLPMLRQQHPSERNNCCISMTDFISPEKDYIGVFAVTVHGGDEWAERVRKEGDDYTSILIKSVADRLAEATADWLHEQSRNHHWGYGKITHAEGIRPAFGYPAMPDISLLKEIDKAIDLSRIGIHLTENCAMRPNASICGLHISHPQSFYFMVGEIAEDQKERYAALRGLSKEELGKWLATTV